MYVLGVDFGGGAGKATLLDKSGTVIASAAAEYPTFYGEDGKAEQNPADWYRAACINIRNVTKNIDAGKIDCVCFDAATHTAVLLDDAFGPLCNAVYWTDTRCREQAERLKKERGEDIFARFKHCPDTIWTLPQLMWLRENRPETYSAAKRIMFAKDYVRHCFTGDFLTDRIEAQGSMLFDYDEEAWSDEYLGLAGLNKSNMPRVVNPSDFAGKVIASAAADSGLKAGTPVIVGATDTAMEVFAAGAVKKGDMTVKLATAGRICLITDRLEADRQLVTYSHLEKGLYYPGTATKSCAASLRWFRDAFGGDYRRFDEEAALIPAGSGGLMFHPYLSGELTPYGNAALRGAFTGITAAHTKAHFARAVMEGVALSLKDCFLYLKNKGFRLPERATIIGGGAKSAVWRQITADALGIGLTAVENSDSSLGAAMLAGCAAGFFPSLEKAAETCRRPAADTVCNLRTAEIYEKNFARYKKTAEFLGSIADE